MRVVLTGVTGFLGRNFLFELMKNHIRDEEKVEIYIAGRDKEALTLKERVRAFILEEGLPYIGVSAEEAESFTDKYLHTIQMHLNEENIFPNPEEYKALSSLQIDHFFHFAALADLRKSETVTERLQDTNINGTRKLLEAVSEWNIQEIDYVSTAYVCGKAKGDLMPDDLSLSADFRNPYERSKAEAELMVRTFAADRGIKLRVFRPGIVCGRLMEKPLGHANKFDVFYEIFAFFYIEKLRRLKGDFSRLHEHIDLGIRAVFDPMGEANIVPVDYVAKVLYKVCEENMEGKGFHLVHEKNIRMGEFLAAASEALRFSGIKAVNKMPSDLGFAEKIYYSRAGNLFTSYLSSERMVFNTDNIQPLLKTKKVHCPSLDDNAVKLLMSYAASKHFGLRIHKLLQRFVASEKS